MTGGLVGVNTGRISGGIAIGSVIGHNYATIGGLVAQNQTGGEIEHSTSTGIVTGQQFGSSYYYGNGMTLGGLIGMNQGEVTYSKTSSQVDYRYGKSQTFGGLVGINYSTMRGNTVLGQTGLLPIAGTNYGSIDMSN